MIDPASSAFTSREEACKSLAGSERLAQLQRFGQEKETAMNILDRLGADDLTASEQHFAVLANYISGEGKPFVGYQGVYLYHHLGYLDLSLHLLVNAKKEAECVGLSTHVMSPDIWHLAISDRDFAEPPEEEDVLSKCLFFVDPTGENEQPVPIHLVHADVLPSFAAGEPVAMQVAGFPHDIHFYENEEAWMGQNSMKFMGRQVRIADGQFLALGIDDSVFIKGIVTAVHECWTGSIKGERIPFTGVSLDTMFGPLTLFFRPDMVPEAERFQVRAGACVVAECVLSGDVAIETYQNGAVYNEECDLKLLRDAFTSGDFSRCAHLFAEDAVYESVMADARIEGRALIMKHLEQPPVNEDGSKRSLYARIGVLTDINKDHPYDWPAVGTRGVLLAYDEPASFMQIAFLTLNEEGKIQNLKLMPLGNYWCRLDEETPSLSEEELLDLLKEGLESKDLTPLFNHLAIDSAFSTGSHTAGTDPYGVSHALADLAEKREQFGISLCRLEVTGADDPEKAALVGRRGIGISRGAAEASEAAMFLTLDGKGEITAIDTVFLQGCTFKDLDAKELDTPENIQENASQSLAMWFAGLAEDARDFFVHSHKDLRLTITGAKGQRTAEGREPVYEALQAWQERVDIQRIWRNAETGRLTMETEHSGMCTLDIRVNETLQVTDVVITENASVEDPWAALGN